MSVPGVHVCGPAIDVRPDSDGKEVIVGSWKNDNGLQLWDLRRVQEGTDQAAETIVLNENLPHGGDYRDAEKHDFESFY